MSTDTFQYSGEGNLEVMLDAANYNAYQLAFILSEIDQFDCHQVRVLDFGAGIGTFADMVRDARPDVVVDCLEPSASQADGLGKRGYTVISDLSRAEGTYDVIYALNVLEHIEDDVAAVRSLGQALSERGTLVVYVPAFMLLFSNMDRLVHHFRRYRSGDFEALASASGLRLRRVRYCDPVGFFAALAYRVGKGSGSLNPRSVKLYDRLAFPLSAAAEKVTGRAFGKNVLAVLSQ